MFVVVQACDAQHAARMSSIKEQYARDPNKMEVALTGGTSFDDVLLQWPGPDHWEPLREAPAHLSPQLAQRLSPESPR